jgi:beta-hydroxylase
MFHETSEHSFVPGLEEAWHKIYQEYCLVEDQLEDWVERDLYDNQWQVYRLFEFPDGEPIEKHCARCPVTTEIIRTCFPRHGVAGFSVLRPQTVIHSHKGYQGEFLRCHLGLRVPAGDCMLEVQGERYSWKTGKAVIFDDRVPHAAWNRTDESRVVLLVDFIPDTTT